MRDKAYASDHIRIPNYIRIPKISEFCFSEPTKCVNKAFNENKLPDTLKPFDIVPVFKKLDPTYKTNFRPVSLLLYCLKYLKKLCMINLMNMWRHF